jgi:hypothetical protein
MTVPTGMSFLYVPGEGHGYPRPADPAGITVAEWLCGTSDRHIAPRVPGSSAHLRRDAPAANSFRLCGVLQSSAHALGITERCALAPNSPTIWRHCRHSDLGWAASPIPPDMIFGNDRSLNYTCCSADFINTMSRFRFSVHIEPIMGILRIGTDSIQIMPDRKNFGRWRCKYRGSLRRQQ